MKLKCFLKFFLFVVFMTPSSLAMAQECWYELPKRNFQVEFTAYKTSAKVGVSGKFNHIKRVGPERTDSIDNMLLKSKLEIYPASLNSGDAGRDKTIFVKFFQKMHGDNIRISIADVEKKTIQTKITMNDISQIVPLKFKLKRSHQLTAHGTIDILDFSASSALKSLNKACELLHKGADGVSKTWSDVDIRLNAQFEKKCE